MSAFPSKSGSDQIAQNSHQAFSLEPITFELIDGWQQDDHKAALAAFCLSAKRMIKRPYSTKKIGIDALALAAIGAELLENSSAVLTDPDKCKEFLETRFEPVRIYPNSNAEDLGFVTGYFEPEILADIISSTAFPVPIFSRPADLVEFDEMSRPQGIPRDFFFARKTDTGFEIYPDRREIENGALARNGIDEHRLALYWCRSRIDLFFVHIQGSARLRLPDGTVRRISYHGKTGHPFTGIGKILVKRGEIAPETVSMQTIRAWLEENSEQGVALMQENQSYIFFQEVDQPNPDLGPLAAASVPLSKGRSLAIDHRLHTFGTPIFVETKSPLPGQNRVFKKLMIAQDTGSAIVGPARGDLFMGSGTEAGLAAGGIRNKARFTILQPRNKLG